MCRPLSHVASPPGGGGACGSTLLTELVTLRLSAGWLETSPPRLAAADNATISDAVAIVLNIFPVPPKASRYQRSNPIASSFDIRTFACRPLTDSPLSPERESLAQPSPQLARTLLLIVPLVKAGIYLVDEFLPKATSSSDSASRSFATAGSYHSEQSNATGTRMVCDNPISAQIGSLPHWQALGQIPASFSA